MGNSLSLGIVEGSREFSILATKVRQPIGEFYSAVISSKKLAEICYFDIRGLDEDKSFTEFTGIQRELSEKRIKSIQQYVQTVDATFPTGIVIAIDSRCASITPLTSSGPDDFLDEGTICRLKISNAPEELDAELDPVLYRGIARVIDGQHRIAGLMEAKVADFDLNVTIFIGLDIAMQANVFAVVNKAQTKVNKSLVYDLFNYESLPSPEKTCHEVAVALDNLKGSPFFQRIKRLGVATDGRFGETLSQATFVEGLIPYISRNILGDRDAARRNKPFPKPDAKMRDALVLRSFFVDGREIELTQLLLNYFVAVRSRWPSAWAETGKGWVLNKTAGYKALIRFFGQVYPHLEAPGGLVSTSKFKEIFDRANVSDDFFTSEQVTRGTSGEVEIYRMLVTSTEIGKMTW